MFSIKNRISLIFARSIRMWKIEPTEFSKNTLNPIRLSWELDQPKPNPDKKSIILQAGDPTIYKNFPHHVVVKEALSEALTVDNFSYMESVGDRKAREAVAEYSKHMGNLTADDVIITTGCSMAFEIACRSLANPCENMLVPRPSWNYSTWMCGSGIVPQYYNLDPEKDWQVNLEHLESLIDSKTRAIIVNSPGNPCGNVFSKEHILDILEIAEKHCLPIISDEIYEFFTYPGVQHYSFAALSKNVPVLVCSGLTKRFLIPSIRVDWLIINDRGDKLKNLRQGFRNIAGRNFFPNSTAQLALPKILKSVPESFFEETNRKIQSHAMLFYNRIKKIEGLHPIKPSGSMYILLGIELDRFPKIKTSQEFSQLLANEQSVFCFPSEPFNFPGFLRIVLTAPEEQLIEACERIEEFCKKYIDN